jgi:DNA polymerase-3 subunit beta
MKFNCARDALDTHLQHLSRIVTVRHSLPVLSHILLETDGNLLRLSGTDLEVAVTTHLPAQVEQEGTFTVPARLFTEFVHQNPDSELSFTLESYELVCKGEKVTARISGLDADEFPPLPKLEQGKKITLPAPEFIAAVKQVSIACANDTSRPVLTGVLLVLSEEMATIAATDSFRLAERHLPIIPVGEFLTLIIPNRSLQEVLRITGSVTVTDLELEIAENGILFRIGDIELYSRLITGNFPKYQAIIPTKFQAEADVTTAELVQALRLMSTFSQAGVANVLLEIAEDGTLALSSHGSKGGSSRNSIYAVLEEGFIPLRVAFNVRFLLDACAAAGSPHLRLRFSGQDTPLVLSTGDPNYLQLVMPIRLNA